jgi:hypothetical protein
MFTPAYQKRSRIFLVTFLVTLSLIFGFIYYSGKVEPKASNTSEISNPNLGIFSADTAPCIAADSIGYISYEDKPINWEKNNKFGLYIYAERKDYFEIAQNLVNSNGGDWGYVLIPYNVKDRDTDKWGRVFEQLNNKHLIPVIQLWDVDLDDYKEQTKEAAEFLNKFVWPIRHRYISVYNEMNDSKFWYGKVDPVGYAQILSYTIDSFKDQNNDFFMMNGAFNVSAPTNSAHIESFEYMRLMNEESPGIFEKLDGWASHPYPQPNFAGNPYTYGRWGIRAYLDELNYLKDNLGVKKELPVFITETGWAHADGKEYNSSYLPSNTVADLYKIAYEEIWLKDDRVRAVMPFTIKYDAPFDHFSWINEDGVPYKQYDAIKEIKKVKAEPPVLINESTSFNKCN